MSSAERRGPRRTTGGRVARLLVALVALAGLFAMHGLAEHGARHHEATAASGLAEAMGGSMSMSHAVVDVSEVVVSGVSLLAQDDAMVMFLCLAILGALAVRLLRARGPRLGLLPRAGRDAGEHGSIRTSRSPPAPDLHALCIQRC